MAHGPGAPQVHLEELYRDDDLVVVNKPSGLAVHRGWAADRTTAMSVVRDRVGRRVHVVHRLDRGTSGALVLAFEAATAAALSSSFRERAVAKRYLALVRGVPRPDEGVVDHPVPRRPDGPRVPARTRYRRLGTALDRYSAVEAIPETGRLHQIRRHMKHMHHPLIGDTTYGDGRENRRLRAEIGLTRLALHASRIEILHPRTAEALVVCAPLPEDLRAPLERLGFDPAALDAWVGA